MELIVRNNYCVLRDSSAEITKRLDKITSYKVKGHEYSRAFLEGYWDGRIRLLRRNDEGLKFPTGLLGDALKLLRNIKQEPEINDQRRFVGTPRSISWLQPNMQLRDYQQEAIDQVLKSRGVLTGRGILKLPIRSGKTVIAAALIHRLGVSTVFVATSQLILAQTLKLFESLFGEKVGVIGDGVYEPEFITVASIQRLQRMDAKVKHLLRRIDLLIVDEVHHMKGDSWRKPIVRCDAQFKIGLSATVSLSRKLCERSAVWLKASTGPIIFDVPMQRLVDAGFILSPNILICDVPKASERHYYAAWGAAYDQLIVKNQPRNKLILDTSNKLAEAGYLCLIDTGRLEHVKALLKEAKRQGVKAVSLYGDVKPRERAQILKKFKAGQVRILIGTIMGEGVDIPVLSGVINAEGGKAPTATIQRMRNLTASPGKKRPILIDFYDNGNRHLLRHSRARLKQYQAESVFETEGPLSADNFFKSLRQLTC